MRHKIEEIRVKRQWVLIYNPTNQTLQNDIEFEVSRLTGTVPIAYRYRKSIVVI